MAVHRGIAPDGTWARTHSAVAPAVPRTYSSDRNSNGTNGTRKVREAFFIPSQTMVSIALPACRPPTRVRRTSLTSVLQRRSTAAPRQPAARFAPIGQTPRLTFLRILKAAEELARSLPGCPGVSVAPEPFHFTLGTTIGRSVRWIRPHLLNGSRHVTTCSLLSGYGPLFSCCRLVCINECVGFSAPRHRPGLTCWSDVSLPTVFQS